MSPTRTVIRPLLLVLIPALACAGAARQEVASASAPRTARLDPHSFARPDLERVRHLDLDLVVDFDRRSLRGRATLEVVRPGNAPQLVLDTRDLHIERVGYGASDLPATFHLGEAVEHLGRPLVVDLPAGETLIHVDYATHLTAAALQWLDPPQTAGGKLPFLFTQSQAILARTWVPCQDTPAVRMTYSAQIRVPPGMLAVMSAENPTKVAADGVYRFSMPQPIPSYLLALAVGDLDFRSLGPRTGVYAESSVVERAAWELADTEKMVDAVEALYGPYRWGRYDVLVLPPSFPFGGMENPRLTFATPTILAGDRSLVALVAHELAHSWSGNLVTNADWNDFWLNEGFTVYLERRVMEAVYGREYAEMLAELGYQDLETALDRLGRQSADTRLHLDLAARDPEDGMSDVAYEKGYLLLRALEEAVGRDAWDPFLLRWFQEHAFRSATSSDFLDFLDRELMAGHPEAEAVGARVWIYGPGLPPGAPHPESAALARVERQIERLREGVLPSRLDTAGWTSHHWVHFLRHLPPELSDAQLAALDDAFDFSTTGNSEVRFAWLLRTVEAGWKPAYPQVADFLSSMGRRKFLEPLYRALAATPGGRERARAIYARARPTYHPLAAQAVDEILGWSR